MHGKQTALIAFFRTISAFQLSYISTYVLAFKMYIHYIRPVTHIRSCCLTKSSFLYAVHHISGQVLKGCLRITVKKILSPEKQIFDEPSVHKYIAITYFRTWQLSYQVVKHRTVRQCKSVCVIH